MNTNPKPAVHRLMWRGRSYRIPLLLLIAIFLIPSPVPRATTVPEESEIARWSIKTGTDPDARLVNLDSSTPQTIAVMQRWAAPVPPNNRVGPFETTQWAVNATLTGYQLEGDLDYHLILQDASGRTMIAEIPSPSRVGPGSPFAPGIQQARKQFDARFKATTSFQTTRIPVRVKGVGMFDEMHSQLGVAENGIEIHPVLSITFGR